jgi:hypothetical protein
MEDIINKKFNKLTIVKRLENSKVHCSCECGGIRICSLKDLKRGRTKSCGCARNTPELRELSRLRAIDLQNRGILRKGGDNRTDEYTKFRCLFKMISSTNRKENLLTIFDLKEIWENQNGKCAYTKVDLILPTHSNLHKDTDPWLIASIDRVDSDKPYEISNVQYISRTLNYAKNTMSHEKMLEFISFLKKNL